MVVYANAASTVFRSFDAGRTWLPAPGLPSIAGSIATAANPGIAYAALTEPYPTASGREGIYRTADGGATWTQTAFHPSASSIHGASGLFVDPATPDTVFALSIGCGFGCAFTTTVRTDDGGASWRETSFLPATAHAHGVLYAGGARSRDHGATSETLSAGGRPVQRLFASAASPTVVAENDAGALFVSTDAGTTWSAISLPRFYCVPDSVSLCMNNGRFRARVSFRAAAEEGEGRAVPLTGDSGAFWFFTSNNLELVVKVVDGISFNGHFWVFVGALTDVEYDLEVFDTLTEAHWTHHNDAGTLASVADTAAF